MQHRLSSLETIYHLISSAYLWLNIIEFPFPLFICFPTMLRQQQQKNQKFSSGTTRMKTRIFIQFGPEFILFSCTQEVSARTEQNL